MDNLVSRRHCEIWAKGTQVTLRDLGSRNTTLVNGRAVESCELKVGDEISVGRARLTLAPRSDHDASLESSRPGSTVSIQSTRAIFLSQSKDEWLAASRRRTVNDLADLFSLAREFWSAETSADLLNSFTDWLQVRFSPAYVWVIEAGAPGNLGSVLVARGHEPEEKWGRILPSVAKFVGRDDGICMPLSVRRDSKITVETLLCAPMRLRQRAFGTVVLTSSPETAAYDESDLQVLMAGANTAVPWFHAIGEIERLNIDNERLRRAKVAAPPLVGSSRALARVRKAIEKSARTVLPVLIEGETGTGKELAARMVHDLSGRAEKPYVAINCGAIPPQLLESELFGHERGAFSGASHRKRGLVECADGGTLFLDEVGELRPEHQAALLRVIETGTFRRLGGNDEIAVSVRFVAATNRNLADMVSEGHFREDLYFRLNVFGIQIPPLRERTADIVPMAEHFLMSIARRTGTPLRTLSEDAKEVLLRKPWPGNARELRTEIERAAALSESEPLVPEDFELPSPQEERCALPTLQDVEREHIERALQSCGGRVADAAKLLGIGRTTLYEKLARIKQDSRSSAR